MQKLLIVDDEPNVLYLLKKNLRSETVEVITAESAREGIRAVKEQRPDAVILDVRLPDMSGLDAFNHMRDLDARLPVIIITAHATTETAIEAMKRGAFEYLLKPIDLHELRKFVSRGLELSRISRVPAVFDQFETDVSAMDRIVGMSPSMQQVYKDIGRVAPQDVNVLVLGESGTGKELVSRAIYQHSARADRPFLAINCAAIPEPLLESELFGHEKGAFTGADRRRIGKFEQAHQGTIFLDEIGDMTMATQAKILRLLQDGRFERVGGNQTIETNVRIIAATNRDLQQSISDGRFREDLFYRLSVFTIHLPPLRERMEDLPLLVEHFAKQFAERLHKHVSGLPKESLDLLKRYEWPGNVRELQSAIKYALVQMTSDVLLPNCFPETIRGSVQEAKTPREVSPARMIDVPTMVRRLLESGGDDIYREIHLAMDRVLLPEILGQVDGNQVAASRLLGISRTTLRTRLSAMELDESEEYTQAKAEHR